MVQLVQCEVGNGKKIFLWHNHWHSKGPLLQGYSPRKIYDASRHTDAKLCNVIKDSNWNLLVARSEALVEIQSLLFDIQPNNNLDDKAKLVLSKLGIYHVGSNWNYLGTHSQPVPWCNLVWLKGSTQDIVL